MFLGPGCVGMSSTEEAGLSEQQPPHTAAEDARAGKAAQWEARMYQDRSVEVLVWGPRCLTARSESHAKSKGARR